MARRKKSQTGTLEQLLATKEIVICCGSGGVGKTTTMLCLIGLLAARSGRILFDGADVTRTGADDRARRGMGYIPQGRQVFPEMTVEENLLVGELIGGPRGTKLTERVYEFFPVLKTRRRQVAGTMSGGEQQQLAIGRALVGNPSLILLDEPSEGVQPSIVQMICETLKSIRTELGTTILFVEQNLDTIQAIGERLYVMEKGQVVAEVAGADVRDPEVIRRHLMV